MSEVTEPTTPRPTTPRPTTPGNTEADADLARNDPQPVLRIWQELGLPGLVDVHTHFLPESVLRKVWQYFDMVGGADSPYNLGQAWPITYRYSEPERLATLRNFGVRTFTSMVYPHKPAMARWLNDWSAGFAAHTPDCLHTATFFPEPDAAAYVPEAIEAGARIFKAHVQVGAYDPRDPLLDPVWDSLTQSGIPTVIHCGSGPAPGPFTGPEPITAVLERFPRLPLIIAHMGMPEYREFLSLAERFERVHLDTTMSFTDFVERLTPFPADAKGRLRDAGDRILFGSDYPNIPYTYHHAVEAVVNLELGDEWLRGVLHDNARRLFPLPTDRVPGTESIDNTLSH